MTRRKLYGATAVAVALFAAAGPVLPAAAGRKHSDPAVTVRVTAVTPTVPEPTSGLRPLTITVSLTNTTDQPITGITLQAERGNPISWPNPDAQGALDSALENPTPPTDGLPIRSRQSAAVDLAPGETIAGVEFHARTTVRDIGDICLCHKYAVYPVWVSAHVTVNGADEVLGQDQTFLPSFGEKPSPVQVSWVWPLIDRPHQLLPHGPFTDDALADSVSTGRLNRSMQVLEQVTPKVPVTLVLDPELLDELQIMATTKYQVSTPSGSTTNGHGQAAAAAWLSRLRTVLESPNVTVALTPYGDPDVQSVTDAGLTWSATMPAQMQQQVTAALGGRLPDSSFAWPPSGTITEPTLDSLVRNGVTSLLLDSRSVQRTTDQHGLPLSFASLESAGHTVTAALEDPAIEHYATEALSASGSATGALPKLLAELGVRAVQSPQTSQAVVIAAPRHFDPSPTNAVNTILSLSKTAFTEPAPLFASFAQAASPGQVRPADGPAVEATNLVGPSKVSVRLPPHVLRRVGRVTAMVPSLGALLAQSPTAQTFLNDLPQAVQLAESAAWLPGDPVGGRAAGLAFAKNLVGQIHGIRMGVHIVNPPEASYTLASDSSPLPVTVENDLNYPVIVRIRVVTAQGLPGLTVKPIGPQRVEAHSKATLHLPTRVERSGRIPIRVELRTPDPVGFRLGRIVPLYVHSTVLGVVGVVITIVAGAVLALALLIRLFLRLRQRRRRNGRATRRWQPDGVPSADVSTDATAGSPTGDPAPEPETVPPSERAP